MVCLVRGLASIALGVAVLAVPEATLELLVRLLGVYAMLAGLVAIAGGARRNAEAGAWRGWLVIGVFDVMLGGGALVWPGAAALALLWPVAVALWAVLGGAALVVAAGQFRLQTTSRWLLRVGGLVAVVFGGVLAVVALPGTQPIVPLMGGFALLAGTLLLGGGVGVLRTPTPRHQPAD
jgi:uncharacterized membrane protein HdeD (DUF308 family)